jgi:lycopene beta-cyclase
MGVLADQKDTKLTAGHGTYLVLELGWAIPVLLIQWAAGYQILKRSLLLLVLGALVPTIYLSFADSVALAQGIWRIAPERISQIYIGNVPVEECIFFLVTNLMIVQSIVLVGLPGKDAFPSWFRLTGWSRKNAD